MITVQQGLQLNHHPLGPGIIIDPNYRDLPPLRAVFRIWAQEGVGRRSSLFSV